MQFTLEPRVGIRALAVRTLLVAFVAAIGFGAFALHTHSARAGGGVVVTVNSTANTDDEVCSGSPNAGSGNCTLREAINDVNGGIADEIHFHTPVFSETTPGVINLESGLGDLPTITREVIIDARGAGVIIDGDGDGDGTYCEVDLLVSDTNDPALACDNGLEVNATHNNFSFTLLGGGGQHFVIQRITDGSTGNGDGDGIWLCGGNSPLTCDTFSFGTVVIDAVDIRHIGDGVSPNGAAQAIDISASNVTDAMVTNSSLSAYGNGFRGAANASTPFPNPTTATLAANSITLDHNVINSSSSTSVYMTFTGNKDGTYGSSINAVVTNNTFVGNFTAVDIFANSTTAEHASYNIDVSHNSDIHASNGTGVRVTILVNALADYLDSMINISDNGDITGGVTVAGTAGDGAAAAPSPANAIDVFVDFNIGSSHSTSAIVIDRNGDITGENDSISTDNRVCCGAGNSATQEINDNGHITGMNNVGVDVTNYAFDETTGVADGSLARVVIDGNESIEGQDNDGVYVDNQAYVDSGNIDESTAETLIMNNGPIRGRGGAGINVYQNYVNSGGGIANNNVATTRVTGNERIRGDSGDGVYIDNETYSSGAEGSGNTGTVEVSKNGDITGSDDGLEIEYNWVGAGSTGPGDNNVATTSVMDNGDIRGLDGHGVYSEIDAGSQNGGPGDGNAGTAEISGNGDIVGTDSNAVESLIYSGGQAGESDDNTATNGVHDNASINVLGTSTSPNGVAFDTVAGDEDQDGYDADGNNVINEVIDNGPIRGLWDSIQIYMFAGGSTSDSVNNHTTTRITGNGALVGQNDDGIDLLGYNDGWVCCDPADTNTVDISNNTAGIVGEGSDQDEAHGIIFDSICCSVNMVTIMDNAGTISGGDGDGIHYEVSESTSTNDFNNNGLADSIEFSINSLMISGNDISGSSLSGIYVFAGAFDGAMAGSPDVAKSVIRDNTINNNGESGIYLDSTQGINVGPANTISGNGQAVNSSVHAGVQIVNDLADCWAAITCQLGPAYLPAGGNRITQNSIFDNANPFYDTLGIDLNPDSGDPRVGCVLKADPISPNNCQQPPVITLIAAGGKVGGTTCALCHVEIFLADPTPADQPRTTGAVQHGEGAVYLATGDADDTGNFTVQLPCGVTSGEITGTTTNKTKDTSEFSENRPFLGTAPCATATNTPADTATPTMTSVPTTPAPPTMTPTPMPTKPCGDVNDNGSVDAVDAQLILQYSAGLVTTLVNLPSGDVNDSGAVNPVDSALILQVEAGLIPLGTLNCG